MGERITKRSKLKAGNLVMKCKGKESEQYTLLTAPYQLLRRHWFINLAPVDAPEASETIDLAIYGINASGNTQCWLETC